MKLNRLSGRYFTNILDDHSGVVQLKAVVSEYPRQLFDWDNLYDARFKKRLLKVLFNQNMIPQINFDGVYQDVERFLSS